MLASPGFPDFLIRPVIWFIFDTLFESWRRTGNGKERLKKEKGGKPLLAGCSASYLISATSFKPHNNQDRFHFIGKENDTYFK